MRDSPPIAAPSAEPASCCEPTSVHVAQVVLVRCERGAGQYRTQVLQVYSFEGDLLAEHDYIHEDPIYPAYFMREAWAAQVPPRLPATNFIAEEGAHA